MGDKGSLVLVNGTPYTWQLTLVHSFQLAQWDASFPRTIAPFAAAAVTVQRSDAPFRDRTQVSLATIQSVSAEVTTGWRGGDIHAAHERRTSGDVPGTGKYCNDLALRRSTHWP